MSFLILFPIQGSDDDYVRKMMSQYLVILLPSTIVAGIVLVLSYKWLRLSEFVGPLYLAMSSLMVIVANLKAVFGDVDFKLRLS